MRTSKQDTTTHVSVRRMAVYVASIMAYGCNGERGENWTLMACVKSGDQSFTAQN